MTADFPAVLDACVLVQAPLRDTLLRLAEPPRLYVPQWSDEIIAETVRTLENRIGLSAQKTAYLVALGHRDVFPGYRLPPERQDLAQAHPFEDREPRDQLLAEAEDLQVLVHLLYGQRTHVAPGDAPCGPIQDQRLFAGKPPLPRSSTFLQACRGPAAGWPRAVRRVRLVSTDSVTVNCAKEDPPTRTLTPQPG